MQLYPEKLTSSYPAKHLLLLLAVIAVSFCIYPFASLLLQQQGHGFATTRAAPEFRLTDANGKARGLSDYRGRYVYLMFGYMRCADICHTQVTQLATVADLLQQDDVKFLYLAMDSRHDKPSMLRAYFDQRGENFTSLHANSLQQMQSIANAYNAGYRISGNPGSDDYDIDHSGKIFLIDPDGQLRFVYYSATTTASQIAADYQRLNNPQPNSINS